MGPMAIGNSQVVGHPIPRTASQYAVDKDRHGRGSTPMGSHFRVGALVYFSGDWDVHWGYGVLTHSHMGFGQVELPPP